MTARAKKGVQVEAEGGDQPTPASTDQVQAAPPFGLSAPVAVRAQSSRAPYTRAGIRFASRQDVIALPETTTPDQFRRLVADVAITLSILHVETGRSVELPRDLFDAEGEPDFDRLSALIDGLMTSAADAEGAA